MLFSSISQANVYQKVFGTSRVSEIINLIVVIAVLILIYRSVLVYLLHWILDYLNFHSLKNRKLVYLELTPPAKNTKTPLATVEWFVALHGLLINSRKDTNFRRKKILSLEIVTTRNDGIRYIAVLDPNEKEIFEQLLVSYMHDIKFKKLDDYLPPTKVDYKILSFKQSGHFAFPLATQDKLSQHDPIAYITGAMSRPQPGELIAMQIVVTPASPHLANRVRHHLWAHKEAPAHRSLWQRSFEALWSIVRLVLYTFINLLKTISGEINIVLPSENAGYNSNSVYNISPPTEHVIKDINTKLDQHLFNAAIRTLVIGPDNKQQAQDLAKSLHLFHRPGYQGLNAQNNCPKSIMARYRLMAFYNRLPTMFRRYSNVLSTGELASLYHFPYGENTSTENLVKSYAKTLPSPIAIKTNTDHNNLDVTLGVNRHHGLVTPIGLTESERERHVYIVGGTGNGKTTLLKSAIIQDIKNGKGVALIDPHGDLAEELLSYIPRQRVKDVIFFDPYDIDYPIGLNLLELPENLPENELAHQKEFLAEAIISIFRKIFSEYDTGGHRIESVLRNAIYTAFTVPDCTLFTIYDLLTDPVFRRNVVAKLDDKRLKQFWYYQFGLAGNMQRVKMVSGVTNKLERLDRSESIKRVIGQKKSTIDFDDIINTGKILICKFSKGAIGNDTSELFGIATIAKLQLAAQRRIHIKPDERIPFYLYVDEFQNFATLTFVELLAEARKFKLHLTMAEQSTAQQHDQSIVHVILDNVGTIICFRFGSPESERLLLPLFKPYVDTGEIYKLDSFNFYMSVRALNTQEPFSGETVQLEVNFAEDIAEQVIEMSRKQYATVYKSPKQ